jgi:hypothetical protein
MSQAWIALFALVLMANRAETAELPRPLVIIRTPAH